jgi:hypothetical protein
MTYSALFNNMFEALNLFLNKNKYTAEMAMAFGCSQYPRVFRRVLAWLAIDNFISSHHIKYNCSCS